jgi:UDP-glucuronate decarboxylase
MESENHKIIYITGGLGFIGINLIFKLLEDPLNLIFVLDNEVYGSRQKVLEKSGLINNNRVKINYLNICNTAELFKNIELEQSIHQFHKIHEIYHLAGIASPLWYKIYPEETLDVSYIGTKNIFNFAKKYNSKVLICSSSEVYGDPEHSPQSETYFGNVNPYGERSCYDEGKRIMESLAYTFQRKYNLDIKIIRIFNTYGPFMNIDDGRVIPSFIKSYLQDKPITIFNNGTQTRSFNYVNDTINGMIQLMASNVIEPINIGNDCEITILHFYEIMKSIIEGQFPKYHKEKKEIVYGISDKDDPKLRRADLTKARTLLNYESKTKLEDGLIKTITYFIEYSDC